MNRAIYEHSIPGV